MLLLAGLAWAASAVGAEPAVQRREPPAGEAIALRCDVESRDDVEATVAATVEAFGGLDIVVNNAGIQHVSPIESFPEESWHQIIAINLSAAFFATREALPLMRSNGWGGAARPTITIAPALPEHSEEEPSMGSLTPFRWRNMGRRTSRPRPSRGGEATADGGIRWPSGRAHEAP